MYGGPEDLPVNVFVGTEFNQVRLDRSPHQFHASGVGSISVEGRWELRDDNGAIVDFQEEHSNRESFRRHAIIGVPIVRSSIDPPRSFSLFFENGCVLTIFDDTPQFESFSVHLKGQQSFYI